MTKILAGFRRSISVLTAVGKLVGSVNRRGPPTYAAAAAADSASGKLVPVAT
jgi:hypothetical protein